MVGGNFLKMYLLMGGFFSEHFAELVLGRTHFGTC